MNSKKQNIKSLPINHCSKNRILLKNNNIEVTIDKLPDGKNNISIRPLNTSNFIPIQNCQTSYSVDLIKKIFKLKGAYLCDEIQRDENPFYVEKKLRDSILLYIRERDFKNKRILDFGCGSGSSTLVFARMFPDIHIIGVDINVDFISVAALRAEEYGFKNIEFKVFLGVDDLQKNIGRFDSIILSAVYEHMLPDERKTILPQLWGILKPGGILFINQTPNRFYPFELHTTGLPFINYLPRPISLYMARKFSQRVSPYESWDSLLRRGIRGGTTREIKKILSRNCNIKPIVMIPLDPKIRDCTDLWFSQTTNRYRRIKRLLKILFRMIYLITDIAIVPPELSLAIKKGRLRSN